MPMQTGICWRLPIPATALFYGISEIKPSARTIGQWYRGNNVQLPTWAQVIKTLFEKRSELQIFSGGIRLLQNDIRSIKWALLFISVCLAFFEITSGSICPVYALTGYPCPGCGLTRAGMCVLRLDFAGAWELNPFIFPIGILLTAYAVNRYILRAFYHLKADHPIREEPLKLPGQKNLRKWLDCCAVLVLAGMLLFYIWRMASCFPGEPPMVYNEENLSLRLFQMMRR